MASGSWITWTDIWTGFGLGFRFGFGDFKGGENCPWALPN